MIIFKTIKFKNLLSYGNLFTTFNLNENEMSLISAREWRREMSIKNNKD